MKIIDWILGKTISELKKERDAWKRLALSSTKIYCKNKRCIDNEDGVCSLDTVIINDNSECTEFGEDDLNIMKDFKESITPAPCLQIVDNN